MRVVTAEQYGPPDVMHIEEQPVPSPTPDGVVVEVKAAGVNLVDTLVRRGEHAAFTPPLSLGVDGAGAVVVAGDQAIAKVGDRVAWEYVAGSYADMGPAAGIGGHPELDHHLVANLAALRVVDDVADYCRLASVSVGNPPEGAWTHRVAGGGLGAVEGQLQNTPKAMVMLPTTHTRVTTSH